MADGLPSLSDHAAVMDAQAANIEARCPDHGTQDDAWTICHCPVAEDTRKRAAELRLRAAVQPFPPDSAWTIQTYRRGVWQRWLADRHDRDEAREDYDGVVTRYGDQWAFRLVRADTSYTVEAEHVPSVGLMPEPLRLPYHPAAEESGS